MCSDYCFDVVLTVPDAFCEELPEVPEPTVKFLMHTYINAYSFKPTDNIISEKQIREYLEDNRIDTRKCSIIQRPKTQSFEALINGYQIYRVHWIIECEFDEDRHYMIIPDEALKFIEQVHELIHDNTLATMEIMNNSIPWENSWIHKKISYAEFRAQGLCNHADKILDDIAQKNDEMIQNTLSELTDTVDKRIKNIDTTMYVQHNTLLQDIKRFEERIKKQVAKMQTPKETVDYTKQIEELIQHNETLTTDLKNSRLTMFCLVAAQLFVIVLLMVHYFTFK